MYRTIKTGAALALTVLTLGACDDSDITMPDNDALTGDFEANVIEFTADGSTADPLDIVADGATFTMTLNEEDGTFASDFRNVDTDPMALEGTFLVQGDRLILDDSPFVNDEIVTETAFELRTQSDGRLLLDGQTALEVSGQEPRSGAVHLEMVRMN